MQLPVKMKRLVPLISDKQPERIDLDRDGNVTPLTQCHQYMNRGVHWKDLSHYDYIACIKMIRVYKKYSDSIAFEKWQYVQGLSM